MIYMIITFIMVNHFDDDIIIIIITVWRSFLDNYPISMINV